MCVRRTLAANSAEAVPVPFTLHRRGSAQTPPGIVATRAGIGSEGRRARGAEATSRAGSPARATQVPAGDMATARTYAHLHVRRAEVAVEVKPRLTHSHAAGVRQQPSELVQGAGVTLLGGARGRGRGPGGGPRQAFTGDAANTRSSKLYSGRLPPGMQSLPRRRWPYQSSTCRPWPLLHQR